MNCISNGQAEPIFQIFVSQQEKELLERYRQQQESKLEDKMDLDSTVELKADLEKKLKSATEPFTVCKKCGVRKNTRLSFYRNLKTRSGYGSTCKKCQDKKNKAYTIAHRRIINEQDRRRRYHRLGRPVPPKAFSFYNDIIREWMREKPEVSKPKFKKILVLRLTDHQRMLVELAMQGYNISQVAQKLGVVQPSITKAWNGQFNERKNKLYGGIYKKYMKAYGEYLKIHGEIK